MPRGASRKREREYKELKQEFKEEGRYKGREEEVAARIVNKQRSEFGETKQDKEKDRRGKSPDRNLPISNYEHLTVPRIASHLDSLSLQDIRRLRDFEESHKNRKTLMAKMESKIRKK